MTATTIKIAEMVARSGYTPEAAAYEVVTKQIAEANAYNGWSNRETWVINLWLTNESAMNALAEELARDGDEFEGAERLESYFGDHSVEVENGMLNDLVNAAFARVNWLEIAKSLRAE